jgi:hypothetical protein
LRECLIWLRVTTGQTTSLGETTELKGWLSDQDWLGNLQGWLLLLVLTTSNQRLDLLLDWLHLLGDSSDWRDDLTDLLHHWSVHGVHSNMGLILRGGLLVGAWAGLVSGLKIERRAG